MQDRFAAWWRSEAPARRAYLIAAGAGLLVYLVVFGPGHMFGTSAYWDLPMSDQRAYLMGYRYWLHEPWHWPLFSSTTMNIPYAKSIAFSDSIPIWAFINKSIATLIPPWGDFTERAYLGLWYAVVYALQACFGVAVLRQLGHRSWGSNILTALFFLSLPSWVVRYSHAALTAHFLLLWAFLMYLRTPSGAPAPRRHYVIWLGQLALTALVNPYHSVMSLAVYVAALTRSKRWRTVMVWAPCGVMAIGLAAWIAGYFSKEAAVHMGGFDAASTNLVSLFIPQRSGLFGDGQWIAKVIATEFQYEGWVYLGIGFMVMLALFVPRIRMLGPVIRRHAVLFAFVVGFWLLALSNKVYFGSHLLLNYDYPSFLHFIPDQFRAPGRFMWVPMYAVVIVLLNASLGRFTRGWMQALLPLLVVAQFADARGDWGWPLQYTAGPLPPTLKLEAWRPLVQAHDQVMQYPPYDCILDGTPEIADVELEIQYLASAQHIPLNGAYSARPTRRCETEIADLASLEPAPNTMYVFLTRVVQYTPRLMALGATCAEFKYGRVCSRNTTALTMAIGAGIAHPIAPGSSSVPELKLAQHVKMDDPADEKFLTGAWSFAEPSGRWTQGSVVSVLFRLPQPPPGPRTLHIEISAPLCGKRTEQDVDASINGQLITTLHFTADANNDKVPRTIPIEGEAAEVLARGGILALDLKPKDIRTPKQIGCNPDPRALGVWVRTLWFE